MKKILFAVGMVASLGAQAMTLPSGTLICENSFYLDKAYNDLINGNKLTLNSLINKNQCGFLARDIDGVEIERSGSVIKGRFDVGGQITVAYFSAAEVLFRKNEVKAQ
jgi:hypothetical protein